MAYLRKQEVRRGLVNAQKPHGITSLLPKSGLYSSAAAGVMAHLYGSSTWGNSLDIPIIRSVVVFQEAVIIMAAIRKGWSAGGIAWILISVGLLVAVGHLGRIFPLFHQRGANGGATYRKEYVRSRAENSRFSAAPCRALGISCSSIYFRPWHIPKAGSCRTRLRHGFPIPDPACTPGGANPSVGLDVLRSESWRTRCIRNCQTTEGRKHVVYSWYGIPAPRMNHGADQICELDHLVPLELGGADGLGNIWPQCGPSDAAFDHRYFKRKDEVEFFLADQVRNGKMSLHTAQREIAKDWTQFIAGADEFCRVNDCS